MTDLSGTTLGQYHIHEMIGRGGMANVYRADQTSMGRQVAIKVLPSHFLQDPMFLQRFMQEVKVISSLQHPHILPVHDYGEQDGMPYIVMALLTGGSLADLIHQRGGLPLPDVVRYVQQISNGLEYAHKKGIIHRDFKPSNVLLDEEGNAYLADFGIAKITESTAQLTGSGMVGTPAYMAPEMAKRGGVTTLVDVYALGTTVYQMLTGRYPYESDTPLGVIMAHITEPIPNVREERPNLPETVQAVIERAMAKDPMDRYQTPGEVATALATVAAGQPIPAVTPHNINEATFIEPTPGFPVVMPESAPRPLSPPNSGDRTAGRGKSSLLIGLGLLVAVGVIVAGILLMVILPGYRSQSQVIANTSEAALALQATKEPATLQSQPVKNVATPTATEVPLPTDTPGPSISNLRFCDIPCDQPGARQITSLPSGQSEVYLAWDYTGMQQGMPYTREWSNQGQRWAYYQCIWQGPESGTRYLELYDRVVGLRSGDWTITITIQGQQVANASILLIGNHTAWAPIGTAAKCPDW